jgi:hypothetical protein
MYNPSIIGIIAFIELARDPLSVVPERSGVGRGQKGEPEQIPAEMNGRDIERFFKLHFLA